MRLHEPFGSMRFDLNGSAAGCASMEFFLKPKLGDHSFDAARGDGIAALTQLLSHHLGRTVRI